MWLQAMDMVGWPSPSPSLTILLPHCMLLAVAVWHLQQISFPPYNTAAPPLLPHGGKFTVHLVSHSHDDVGWFKTVDQYFLGSNNSIQVAAVQHVLDSVVAALQEDPTRKFVYAEQVDLTCHTLIGFFPALVEVAVPSNARIVKKLVDSGQLEFMHFTTTELVSSALVFLHGVQNAVTKTAYLLHNSMGFDDFFFARADYQDITKRREDRTMEVIWRGSKFLGASAQDDPLLEGYNVPQRVDYFVDYAHKQSNELLTNHIMWPMGDDFAYENADTWFKQIVKLIHYVNKDGRVNALYSTPSIYLDAVHAGDAIWHLKTDDYYPYSDCPHCFWTGYFTSRPALKGYVRKLSGFLQVRTPLY